jgi:UDP-N-acetylglucosamine 4,6-dehydratase (inverting)
MSKFFVTGGTGSFGQKFIEVGLKKNLADNFVIYSRDEMKQWDLANSNKFIDKSRVSYVIGDVRDYERLHECMKGSDYVVHAAATKIVPTAETNPYECVKTNIDGAINVIRAAKNHNILKTVALSTDKACNPVNLYGATKLASDKLFVSANISSDSSRFSVVRYGNVMASRGSVIPFFKNLDLNKSPLPVTDRRMTRFMITLEQAVDLVYFVFREMLGGEIYIKKIPSMSITDIAYAVNPGAEIIDVGIRPGEKIHEEMITSTDSRTTYEFDDHYIILPEIFTVHEKLVQSGSRVSEDFCYRSDTNSSWMSSEQLHEWISKNVITK